LVRFGLPMDMVGFLATSGVLASMSALMVAAHGKETLGLVSFALIAEGVISQLSVSVTQIFIPRISAQMGATGDLRACARYALKPAWSGTLFMCGVAALAMFACEPAVRLLTPKYTGSVPYIRLFVWGGIYPMLLMPNHVFIAAKHRGSVMYVFGTTAVAFAALAGICIWLMLPPLWLAAAYLAAKMLGGALCQWKLWFAAFQPAD
jgi:O-antigen/teichoic acid export membrane protein